MITTETKLEEKTPATFSEQFSKQMPHQLRPNKNSMNLVIPRRNILIIAILGVLSWVFVAALFAFFLN